MKPYVMTLFVLTISLLGTPIPAIAAIPPCDVHNGMSIWFLDYDESDTVLAHPLGVLKGVVEINEAQWHSKCGADGPSTKVFVPFNYTKNGKNEWDTRWPKNVYRTQIEAARAYRSR